MELALKVLKLIRYLFIKSYNLSKIIFEIVFVFENYCLFNFFVEDAVLNLIFFIVLSFIKYFLLIFYFVIGFQFIFYCNYFFLNFKVVFPSFFLLFLSSAVLPFSSPLFLRNTDIKISLSDFSLLSVCVKIKWL